MPSPSSALRQPTIVFTPSTPTMSPVTTEYDVEDFPPFYSSYQAGNDYEEPRHRASLRSFSVPSSQYQSSRTEPVILHRPRNTSPSPSRWTFAKARRSILDSCWKSEKMGYAVASELVDGRSDNEKRSHPGRTMSEDWAGRARVPWDEMRDDDDSSEPDSTPSTPVFPHRTPAAPPPDHGSRFITLISTLVIALAFASLAFTTFFHPTFGDKISKLPESTMGLATLQEDEGWTHRFLHFDGLFGHSDDDGLVGISSSPAGSNDLGRELRKRGSPGTRFYSGWSSYITSDPASVSGDVVNLMDPTYQPRPHWIPWHWPSFASGLDEEDEAAFEHRRSVDKAGQRLIRRREALAAQQRR